jgi:hypothetical protein
MPTHIHFLDLPLLRRRVLIVALTFLAAVCAAASPAHSMTMQVDPQIPCVISGANVQTIMKEHHATVLRIVLPDFPSPNALLCVERAAAEGYRVYISMQYDNAWSPQRVAAYFARALPQYAPYVWAVAVGNEQDVRQGARPRAARVCAGSGGQRRCRVSAGGYYRQVWNAVEPVLARVAAHAVRVYGETSPWGFRYLQDSFQTGRPHGAQAVAFHCYDTKRGGLRSVPQVAAWVERHHLPLWCSEMSDGIRPRGWMRRDTPRQWQRLVAGIERRSPDLKMVSYYQWAQIGAR